jgi:hypothetical protein
MVFGGLFSEIVIPVWLLRLPTKNFTPPRLIKIIVPQSELSSVYQPVIELLSITNPISKSSTTDYRKKKIVIIFKESPPLSKH